MHKARELKIRAHTQALRCRYAVGALRTDDHVVRRALCPGTELDDVLARLRSGHPPGFLFDRRQGDEITGILRSVPGWTQRTTRDADLILKGAVRLLGCNRVDLSRWRESGHPSRAGIPWHADVLNGYQWNPRTFYRNVERPVDRADIKVPWELSRCQHLPTLGMAYLATRRPRYAAEVASQIEDWVVSNPAGFGVNWACAMDVAIRAVNWLWALSFIAQAPELTDTFLTLVLGSLLAHGRHIRRNIERSRFGISTNHTLAGYVGLLYLGVALTGFREAAAWVAAGRTGIVDCMRSQVAADGVNFENSIPYHRLVLEMFAGTYVISTRNGMDLPEDFAHSLERMFEFIQHYTRPDGRAPIIGDCDDGRLQILSRYFDWEPQDHRYLLALGAALFNRDDFASLALNAPGGLEEVAWLLGADAGRRVAERPALACELVSRAFAESGRYVLRHGRHHAIVCTDPVGSDGIGNHKHNDILGFELTVSGVSMVVDPGSFLYTSDTGARNRFRSTRAHNTVMVDGVEQNRMPGPFWMLPDARVHVLRWRSGAAHDVLDALHTGYARLAQPVTHRRTIVLRKAPFGWLVVDRLDGKGWHTIVSSLHLAPGGHLGSRPRRAELEVNVGSALASLSSDLETDTSLEPSLTGTLSFCREGVRMTLTPLNWPSFSICNGWFAPRYGQCIPTRVLRLAGELPCPMTLGYLILEH